jgi:hypothetical protein
MLDLADHPSLSVPGGGLIREAPIPDQLAFDATLTVAVLDVLRHDDHHRCVRNKSEVRTVPVGAITELIRGNVFYCVITGRPGRAVRLSFRRRRVISLLVGKPRGTPCPTGARSSEHVTLDVKGVVSGA